VFTTGVLSLQEHQEAADLSSWHPHNVPTPSRHVNAMSLYRASYSRIEFVCSCIWTRES
jgi:hypothetical protein